MDNIIAIAQIAVSVVLMILILLQQRGTALGSAFGQGDSVYTAQRGIQKRIYYATIACAAAFIGLALFAIVG